MIKITNEEFLQTCFGENWQFCHVTSFHDDPSDIQGDRRFSCWGGDYYGRTSLQNGANQYFTVSIFNPDDKGKARRRKALFMATYVIVLDDVHEKLPIEQVNKLPLPTYKMQTSPGSEQWGYILDYPCSDRHRVENLLDGLVAQGLAPQGKDPGMKGVTRYVRLPEGYNTKASKLVNGKPTKCLMLEWHPERKVNLESLALPFGVDLDAERREGRVDGAAEVSDHPLLQLDIIDVKSVRSAGRFDVTCPWVAEHTGEKNDGAAIFTNKDGSIGFKCHHGVCQDRTGRDLLELIEESHPGFKERLNTWQILRSFGATADLGKEPVVTAPAQTYSFLDETAPVTQQAYDFLGDTEPAAPAPETSQSLSYSALIDQLRNMEPHTPERITFAHTVLKAVDELDHGNRLTWWGRVQDIMGWRKPDLMKIIEDQRQIWYHTSEKDVSFYEGFNYVAEQNAFYSPLKRLWLSPEAFQNAHSHINDEARSDALTGGQVQKTDRLDYAPGESAIFTEAGIKYTNAWVAGRVEVGVPGPVERWLNHFDQLGWSEYREHVLRWMSWTLRYPESKINHMLVFGGGQGTGKDFLLYPLIRAMGRDATVIDGNELLSGFNDYLFGTKYLHVNETELGDRSDAKAVENKLKSMTTTPPATYRINPKGIKSFLARNIVNITMTTNSAKPLELSGDTRRFYGMWTDVNIRNPITGQVTDEWRTYWDDRWNWMRDSEGWKCCASYLQSEVDLSCFDPGGSPLVTEFIREIQEASEDPLVTMIKDMIRRCLGFMASDLVTSSDIAETLKIVNLAGYDLRRIPNPGIIGKIMKQHALGLMKRTWLGSDGERVWILRNQVRYANMGGKELHHEYLRQIAAVRQGVPLTVVGSK